MAEAATNPPGPGARKGAPTRDRIDRLVGDHAEKLSERLQAHRAQLFPPNARKKLRRFTSGEAADLLGVKDAYLRKLHLEGKGPSPEIRTGGRRYYSPDDIQALRVDLEARAKTPGAYLPGRRPGDGFPDRGAGGPRPARPRQSLRHREPGTHLLPRPRGRSRGAPAGLIPAPGGGGRRGQVFPPG